MSGFEANGQVFHPGDQVIVDVDNSSGHYSDPQTWVHGVVECTHRLKMCVRLEDGMHGCGCDSTWSINDVDHYFVKLERAKETMPLIVALKKQTSLDKS